MSTNWQDKPLPSKLEDKRKLIEEAMKAATPTPGNPRSHTLGYRADDWEKIEAVKRGDIDPQYVVTRMSCAACSVKIEVFCSRIITDNMISWLCEDCIDAGFAWAKDITRQQFLEYQLVKEFKYDTLMRRLDKSPNPRGAYHDPFDPEDRRKIIVPGRESDYSKDPFEPEMKDLGLPQYGTPGAAGVDLRSAEALLLNPGQRALVKTGIFLEIPVGLEGQVRSRSGLAYKNGVFVLNSPGTIDSDYRGEIGVILFNSSNVPFEIKVGDRIAQMVFSAVAQVTWVKTEELGATKRSNAGFGSTGVS